MIFLHRPLAVLTVEGQKDPPVDKKVTKITTDIKIWHLLTRKPLHINFYLTSNILIILGLICTDEKNHKKPSITSCCEGPSVVCIFTMFTTVEIIDGNAYVAYILW